MKASNLIGAGLIAGPLFGCVADPADKPAGPAQQFNASYVELQRARFQQAVDGKNVDLYTIANDRGMFVKLTNYGAKIEQIVVPDRDGKFGDVVLGYDSLDAVIGGQASMGAFMGRYANRIAGGKFTLDGVTYQLALNDGNRPNSVHGGVKGARFRVFDAIQLSSSSVQMSYVFQDGEESFPGALSLQVVYSLGPQNELYIACTAKALDKKTIFNFTSHPFFNLGNDPASLALDHVITVNADTVLEIDKNLIPTEALRSVAGTPMDFRAGKPLGQDLAAGYDLLTLAGGYDHTYVINKTAEGRFTFAASAYEAKSGRLLEVFSTEPGLQLYSGNGFAAQAPRDLGKGNTLYALHAGFAMEPMHYPDSPNRPSFPSTVLGAGETYKSEIVFKFGIK